MERIPRRRLTERQFAAELREYAEGLRKDIQAQVEGFPADAASSQRRRDLAQGSFRHFRRCYFPHYTTHADSAVHVWMERELPRSIDRPRGTRTALAAPRGSAKSTVAAMQFVLWCLLTERKRYVLLLSDTADQAALLLAALQAEVDANPRLRMDWPDDCRPGGEWRQTVAALANGRCAQAFGAGQKVRGRRRGPHRPDLVVADDVENDAAVRSPKRRKALAKWWREAVQHAGPPGGGMDVVLVGTVLHGDSLLAGLIADPMWRSAVFRSIVRWPDRGDLWDAWTEIARSQGEDAAMAHYARRRREMDAGAKLNWPDAQPLAELMLMRATAPAAFAQEHQQQPAADEDAIFAGLVRRWEDRPRAAPRFGAVDPSLGKSNASGDPSAILVGELDRRRPGEPRLLVLEASIRRRPPDRIIDDAIAMQRRHGCVMWAVESNAYQDFLRSEIGRRSVEAGVPMPVRGVVSAADKALRIESLQPHFAAGRILLGPGQEALAEQLEQWPAAAHDDGPDALHMLWGAAMGSAHRPLAETARSAPARLGERIPWEAY